MWPILKDVKFFSDNVNNPTPAFQRQTSNFASSQSESSPVECPTSVYPGLSAFDLNINDEEIGGNSSQRPIEVKKAKDERKNDTDMSKFVETIHGDNKQSLKVLKKSNSDRQKNYEIQMLRAQNESKNLVFTEFREENKILFVDLDSIKYSNCSIFQTN